MEEPMVQATMLTMPRSLKSNSPFRYPGGKFYARRLILEMLPYHQGYCEPFAGGASIFFAKDKVTDSILNDLDEEVINTLIHIRDDVEGLIGLLEGLPASKELHAYYKVGYEPQCNLERAFRWFYLNRTSYSGIMRPQNCFWGYGEKYSMRPENWPPHLRTVSDKLQEVALTVRDFENVIDELPDGFFVFADPPYYNADQQKFYNCTFATEDHERLAACLERNADRLLLLLTYDDNPEVRGLYSWTSRVSSHTWNYTINRTDYQKTVRRKRMDSSDPGTRGMNSLSATMMLDNDDGEILRVFKGITEYCQTYNIPRQDLLDILEDQKVLPMIRGKATEYIGAALLRQVLDPRDWLVEKLNLSPQPRRADEDVSITFRRTGTRLTAETKNANRGSFKLHTRRRPEPHFTVKCHKSRSSLKLQGTTNDRYLVGEFDLLLCNVSNALFRTRALERRLPLIDNPDSLDWLKTFYGADTDDELVRAAYDDWRLCLPVTIADEDGVIPRQPVAVMENDPNWFGPDQLAPNLRTLINGIHG